MAIKNSQARLTVPKDIWDIVGFNNYDRSHFGFFISDDSRVLIMDISLGEKFRYEFLGKCGFDEKHRFFIPKNVDAYLGHGSTYYFTTSICHSSVYIYKLDESLLQKRQNLQMRKLLASL